MQCKCLQSQGKRHAKCLTTETSKMSTIRMDETMIQGAEECSQAINAKSDRSYELSTVMIFTGRAVRWSLLTQVRRNEVILEPTPQGSDG